MSDPLSLRQCAFTSALARLILFIESKGYQVKIQELNRLIETQKEYVAQGVSKTMDSRHLLKLAADLVLFKNGELVPAGPEYQFAGDFWTTLGGVWGGSWQTFKDWPHFEFHP